MWSLTILQEYSKSLQWFEQNLNIQTQVGHTNTEPLGDALINNGINVTNATYWFNLIPGYVEGSMIKELLDEMFTCIIIYM